MRLSSRARAAAIVVALLVTLSLPLIQQDVLVYAPPPYLTEIFGTLGFDNVAELAVQTFPEGKYNITLYAKFGGDNTDNIDANELSFYEVGTSVFNVLYASSEPTVHGYVTPPLSKTFAAGYTFGFSLLSWMDTRYFTQTALNPDGNQHAKVYLDLDDPSILLIAFDERSVCTTAGDGDFNDMVFSLQAQYYLDVISPYAIPNGKGWYNNGTNAYASVSASLVDHGNGTRRLFTQWGGDASGSNYSMSNAIHMSQNRTAVAFWNTQHYLSVRTDPTGIVTIPGEGWYDQATSKTVTAPVVSGHAFAYWDVDGVSQGDGINPVTVMMNGPHTVTAHYLDVYILTIEAGPGGSTDPPIGTHTSNAGSTIQVTATPNATYAFDHWELDGANVGSSNPYSVLMDGNHTLKAIFKALPPPLAVTIVPMSSTILLGQSVNFTSNVSGGTSPYTYQWYLNGSPVSGATSDTWTFTPTAVGVYDVYLRVMDVNGTTAQSGTAKVTVTTPIAVSISPLLSSIFLSQNVTFHSTVAGGTPPYTYQWYLDGSAVALAKSDSWVFKPQSTRIYYVYLRVIDALGQTAQSETARVEVHSTPVGGYSVSFEKQANTDPLVFSLALTILLGTFFVTAKRRTARKAA